MKAPDLSVRDTSTLRPKLRPDISCRSDKFQGRACWIIENSQSSEFFRIGEHEYQFIQYLDGQHTLAEVVAELAKKNPGDSLSQSEALHLMIQLAENELLETKGELKRLGPKKSSSSKSNLLFLKIPLINPNRLLESIYPVFRPLFSILGFLLWLSVLGIGGYSLVGHSNEFALMTQNVILPNNWIWILLAWISLKLAHETFHGLAAKHFKLQVPEAGIILVLFTPIGYVDATSSWKLSSKWKRMLISAAGMYIELFLAAIAAIIWTQTSVGPLNSIAYYIMVTGSIVTLFFNANPLMKFDGYYLLADFLEIPNLYPRSQNFLLKLAKKYLLGVKVSKETKIQGIERFIVPIYGIAAFVWRIIVISILLAVASTLFEGIGIGLVLIALVSFFIKPLFKFIHYLLHGNKVSFPKADQYLPRLTLFSLILIAIGISPYYSTQSCPAYLHYAEATLLRPQTAGFSNEDFPAVVQRVSAGQTLLSLSNPDDLLEYQNLERTLEQKDIEAHYYLSQNQTSSYQITLNKIESIKEQLSELKRHLDSLVLRSPTDGLAIPIIQNLHKNSFLPAGTSVVKIIPDGQKLQANLVIPQHAGRYFQAYLNKPIQIKIEGQPTVLEATLTRMEPHASSELSQQALAATNGGPLAVRIEGDSPQLTHPHLHALAEINTPLPSNLFLEGFLATVKIKSLKPTPIWKSVYNYVKDRFQPYLDPNVS